MAKLRLNEHSLIPYFHLQSKEGRDFDSSSLKKKKNLVLFFLASAKKEFFLEVEEAYEEIKRQNAEVAVICPFSPDKIQEFYRNNRLTFSILSDENREVISQFIDSSGEEEVAALFMTDKSGNLFFQYLVNDLVQLPSLEEVIQSLALIESQDTGDSDTLE